MQDNNLAGLLESEKLAHILGKRPSLNLLFLFKALSAL